MVEKWQILDSRELFRHGDRLRVHTEHVRLPDGREITDFLQFDVPSYSVVAAITPEGLFVCERHYKHGPRREILSLPAGTMEAGETPLDTAKRELREETGYEAARWTAMFEFLTHANAGGGVAYAFLAQDCVQVCEPDSGDLETITVERKSAAELLNAMRQGEMPIMSDRGILLQVMVELGMLVPAASADSI